MFVSPLAAFGPRLKSFVLPRHAIIGCLHPRSYLLLLRAGLLLGGCWLLPSWLLYAAAPAVPEVGDSVGEQGDAAVPRVVAKEVDLGEPVEAAEPLQVQEETLIVPGPVEVTAEPVPAAEQQQRETNEHVPPVAPTVSAPPTSQSETTSQRKSKQTTDSTVPALLSSEVKPFVMLGVEVPPATATRLSWSPSHSFEGIAVPTPVLVVNGADRGHVLCLTAAVHGDELNGIEIVRRVLYNLDADSLSGTVVGVPIVNLQGFRRGSRYLPDRRDLNRFFPGDPTGSSASRIAHSFFDEVIRHCDSLVDLHTGSFYRTNLPQLRADLRDQDVLRLTHGFDATVVLHSEGALGTLRKAAVMAGIPAVTLEAGEPMRLQEGAVAHGVKSVESLLNKLGMTKKPFFWGKPEPVYYQSVWVRSERGGILFSEVVLGEQVRRDALLGTVTDPITNVRTEIRAPHSGRVLGMAVDQVVMPGFATYRLGLPADEDEAVPTHEPDQTETPFHTSQLKSDTAGTTAVLPPPDESGSLQSLEDSE